MTNKSKGKLQGVIIGTLIGTLLAGGATGYALSTGTLRDVLMDGVKIVVDGKELHPTDANGKSVEPFIYNGTTYLPVRAVAHAINKAVYWDGPEFTVYLGEMDGKLEHPTVKLEDMVSIGTRIRKTDELTDNYGNNYSRAIFNYWDNGNLEYLLNMKYSRFKGTLYIPNGVYSNDSCYLTIEADGKTLYTSPKMTKSSRPIDIDISVKGYNDIKITFSKTSGLDDQYMKLCLADAGFYQ